MHSKHCTLALLLVGALGCSPEATLPADTFEPVRIAIVTSLTGTLGSDGPGWADASRLAALEINAAGGPLPGRPIELLVLDDETNPARAAAIGERLVNEDVAGVVGAAASSITLGIADVTVPARIPQVSCCSTSDVISERNADLAAEDRFLFRTSPPDGLQSVVVAIAAEDLGCMRLAILHLDDDYGQPFGTGIEQAFTARGRTVVVRVPFPDEQATYTTELTQVRDANPDCIAMVAFPGSGGTIVRDWASLSGTPAVTWIGTDGVRQPSFATEVGDASLLDGFFGTSPITDAATPEYNAFRDRFQAVFSTEPIPFSSNQYDATALLALAIARAGSTDGDAIRDALREVASPPADRGIARAGRLQEALLNLRDGRDIDYQGASGNTNFDELGDVVSPYEIWRFDGPGVDPCPGATVVPGDNGSFCRFRTLNAEDIQP
jgi:ABC-type branched-subunit amino acid transport system substrate-binding protein